MSWPRAIGVLLVLGSLGAAPVLTRRARAVEAAPPGPTAPATAENAGRAAPKPVAKAAVHVAPSNDRPGVGVELQVLDLHLELAWFESIPVSPGRRLVLSWLARAPRGE